MFEDKQKKNATFSLFFHQFVTLSFSLVHNRGRKCVRVCSFARNFGRTYLPVHAIRYWPLMLLKPERRPMALSAIKLSGSSEQTNNGSALDARICHAPMSQGIFRVLFPPYSFHARAPRTKVDLERRVCASVLE
jgi:hypothetical protein